MTEFSITDSGPLLLRLWKNKWIIIFITLSGFLAGMAFTANDKTEINYRATSTVCVTYTTYQEQMRGSSVITSYSDLVSSYLVCVRATEILGDSDLTPESIQNMISNWVGGNSYVMYITANAGEPQLAIRVVNAVAQAFTEKVSNISGNNSLQILDVAQTAEILEDTSNTTILAASAAVPFVLACAWIVIREIIGGKIRSISQCADDQDELFAILPETK